MDALAKALSVPPFIAQILVNRGLADAETAHRHLRVDLRDMPAPGTLRDCERAARRLLAAIDAGERIAVYGDYDVDGVTSTALLQLFFRHELGVEIGVYIPHRMREGYGLNCDAISRLAAEGTQVLVTVDNGSSAVKEVAHAVSLGLDVIVIDHHQVSDPAPAPYAHLNPHRPDCDFPEKVLAAVGVAFFLLVELRRVMRLEGRFTGRPEPRPDRYLDLVALGTVADVAPLTGVNRAIVRHGVELMRRAPREGIRGLMATARVEPDAVTARDLGYKLGPRVNAAGRLGDATCGLELLCTTDPVEAGRLAAIVESKNDERREIEHEATRGVFALIEASADLQAAPAFVLANADWHPGVVGIIAARLVDRFQRPTILLARDGDHWKGSARSAGGIDLKAALDLCATHLVRYGGHAAAAGLTLHHERLGAFTEAFQAIVKSEMPPVVEAGRLADACAPLSALDLAAVEHLERLGPFGAANPVPTLFVGGVHVVPRRFGETHLRLELPAADLPREAVGWGLGEHFDACRAGPVDLLCTPELDTYRGRRRIVLRLLDLRPAIRG